MDAENAAPADVEIDPLMQKLSAQFMTPIEWKRDAVPLSVLLLSAQPTMGFASLDSAGFFTGEIEHFAKWALGEGFTRTRELLILGMQQGPPRVPFAERSTPEDFERSPRAVGVQDRARLAVLSAPEDPGVEYRRKIEKTISDGMRQTGFKQTELDRGSPPEPLGVASEMFPDVEDREVKQLIFVIFIGSIAAAGITILGDARRDWALWRDRHIPDVLNRIEP